MSHFRLFKQKESPEAKEDKDKWLYYAKELVQEKHQHFKVKRRSSTRIYKELQKRMSTLHEKNEETGCMDWKTNSRKKIVYGVCRRKSLEKLKIKKESKICKNNCIIIEQ